MSDGKRTSFQAPKGTRDFYPQDLLRRRYIIDTWRRVSLRHGFEEIDGPTFEDSQLYTVKSGEGILNELFGAYSGKDPNDTKQVQGGGPPPFALRPEFTPTLARMYAARARQLPQPTKWFCVSNFFRAERPQRGRLREFWQWNADVLGGTDPAEGDSNAIACLVECMGDVGLEPATSKICFSDRNVLGEAVRLSGVPVELHAAAFSLLDKLAEIPNDALVPLVPGSRIGVRLLGLRDLITGLQAALSAGSDSVSISKSWVIELDKNESPISTGTWPLSLASIVQLGRRLKASIASEWLKPDVSIVRGLAYYTGTVFELIAEGERAVAGGGRYDKLIELFGGPPTPAVGFGMGDVVLTNLLDDRKLMPEGRDLLEATSRPLPVRPDVFVIANESDESQAKLVPTVASLRRGVETDKYKQGDCKPWSHDRYADTLGGVPPLHARRSYKATKNIGKLLADATACHARFALIIESPENGTLKNLDTGEQTKDVPLEAVGGLVARG